jgi:hypothetical protein
MRAILVCLLGATCLLLTACKHAKPSSAAANEKPPRKAAQKSAVEKTGARDVAPVQPSTPAPQAVAVIESSGKVASVNPSLRFVVIDFGLNAAPAVDQRLGVYRQGQKVGEVKISGQGRNNIIAADITAGEAALGDEIRPQ